MIYIFAEWIGEKIGRAVLWCRWVPIVVKCNSLMRGEYFNTCRERQYTITDHRGEKRIHYDLCRMDGCPKLHGGDSE